MAIKQESRFTQRWGLEGGGDGGVKLNGLKGNTKRQIKYIVANICNETEFTSKFTSSQHQEMSQDNLMLDIDSMRELLCVLLYLAILQICCKEISARCIWVSCFDKEMLTKINYI